VAKYDRSKGGGPAARWRLHGIGFTKRNGGDDAGAGGEEEEALWWLGSRASEVAAGLRRWQHAVLRCTKVGDDPWLGRTGSVRPNGPGEW
jgi:hypothetical protein